MTKSVAELKRKIDLLEQIQRNIQDSFFTDEERLQVDERLRELQQELFEEESMNRYSIKTNDEETKRIEYCIQRREEILNNIFCTNDRCGEEYMDFFRVEHTRLKQSLESD